MRSAIALAGMVGGKIAGAVLAMAATVIASRVLSLADFGTVSVLLSTSTIIAAVLDFGSTTFVRKRSRVFSKSGSELVGAHLGNVAASMVARGGVLLLSALLVSAALASLGAAQWSLWICAISVGFSLELLLSEALRTRRHFIAAEFIAGGLRQTIYIAVAASAYLVQPNAGWVGSIYSLAMPLSAVALLSAAAGVRFRPRRLKSYRPLFALALVSERSRFFLVGALNILLNQLAVVYAGYFASAEIAGIVRVSLMFGMVMQLAVGSIAMYYSPRIGHANQDQLKQIARSSSRLGLLALPAAAIGILITPTAIHLLFGPDLAAAAPGAQVLIATYGIVSIFGAFGQIVLLRGGERASILAVTVSVLVTAAAMAGLASTMPVLSYPVGFAIGILTSYAVLGIAGWRTIRIAPGPF